MTGITVAQINEHMHCGLSASFSKHYEYFMNVIPMMGCFTGSTSSAVSMGSVKYLRYWSLR